LVCQPQKTNDEISAIAEIFMDDCGHMSAENFEEAVKLHRRRSRWFPAPSDILKIYQDEILTRWKEMPDIPMLTDGQLEENLKRIAQIKERLAKKSRLPPKKTKQQRDHEAMVRHQAKRILKEREK
jgi:hypothetical protein